MKVALCPSLYVEDPTGAHENLLVLIGSGPAQVSAKVLTSAVSGTGRR
jgi:hypothetical protein